MSWLDENGRDAYLMGFAQNPGMFKVGFAAKWGGTQQEIDHCYWWLVGGSMNQNATGEFVGWPKISRLNRDVCITEKIDGTNAAIGIIENAPAAEGMPAVNTYTVYAQSRTRIITPENDNMGFARWVEKNKEVLIKTLGPGLHFGEWWGCGIQRGYDLSERRFSLFNVKRWEKDPVGKAALQIARDLDGVAIYAVPILYEGPWTGVLGYIDGTAIATGEIKTQLVTEDGVPAGPEVFTRAGQPWLQPEQMQDWEGVQDAPNPRPRFAPNFILEWLKRTGSQAAEGFMQPEGIVVYHKAGDACFKVTVDGDEKHKFEA